MADDSELNLKIAALLGLEATQDGDEVLVEGEAFDPIHTKRQCDPLMIDYGVDLTWAEGCWSAQTAGPGGRAVVVEDESPTRAVVLAILEAHRQEEGD